MVFVKRIKLMFFFLHTTYGRTSNLAYAVDPIIQTYAVDQIVLWTIGSAAWASPTAKWAMAGCCGPVARVLSRIFCLGGSRS